LSWWMAPGQDFFQVHFKSYGIERAEKLVRLGPIGDPQVACSRFQQLLPMLREIFPVSEWICNERMISISTVGANPAFEEFRDLLWQGRAPSFLPQLGAVGRGRGVILYLTELALVRQFWMELQKKLKM